MGTFKTNCAHCGTRVEVDDAYAGARTQCPGCGQMMDLIPEGAAPPPPPTVPPAPPVQPEPERSVPPQGNFSQSPNDGAGQGGPYDSRSVESALDRLGDRLTTPGKASFFTHLADFLCFRRMIVPSLVIALGAVSLVVCIIVAIVYFCKGEWLYGFGCLLGWLVLRMFYEFFMVLFAINDNLTTIKNQNLRK